MFVKSNLKSLTDFRNDLTFIVIDNIYKQRLMITLMGAWWIRMLLFEDKLNFVM